MTSPVFLFQHDMSPRPGVMGKKGHVLQLQYRYVLAGLLWVQGEL